MMTTCAQCLDRALFTVDTGDHVNSSASFINLNSGLHFGSDNGMLYAVDMMGVFK